MYIFHTAMYREWSAELHKMVKEFEDELIVQAKSYVKQDLKNWIASVRLMSSECSL